MRRSFNIPMNLLPSSSHSDFKLNQGDVLQEDSQGDYRDREGHTFLQKYKEESTSDNKLEGPAVPCSAGRTHTTLVKPLDIPLSFMDQQLH
jgi:hypothetical protein